jgi:hypothetical protein
MDVIGSLYVSLGSSTVHLHDSLRSRHACACSEAGFSSQIGDCVEKYTTEEQRSVMRFLWVKGSVQSIFIKKCFLFTVGSVCRVKRFTTGSRNSLKDVRKSQMMPDRERKWLRQQSKDFHAVGFDALVSTGTSACVGGGYVEKYFFPQFRITHVLGFIYICELFTNSPSYDARILSNPVRLETTDNTAVAVWF